VDGIGLEHPKKKNMSKQEEQRPPKQDGLEDQGQNRSQDTSRQEETPIYLNSNTTLQSEEEHRHDQQTDPREDQSLDVNRDDLHEVRLGRLTGRDANDSDKA
jgi:hypothetical protein